MTNSQTCCTRRSVNHTDLTVCDLTVCVNIVLQAVYNDVLYSI